MDNTFQIITFVHRRRRRISLKDERIAWN